MLVVGFIRAWFGLILPAAMFHMLVLLTFSVEQVYGSISSSEPDVHGAENIPNFETIVFGLEPSFDVPVINVTVKEGDTAMLPCSVDYLGDHKVVWTDQWSTLLTLDDRRIIDDSRISVERPYTRDWNLHIRKVVYNDRGKYTCQINTNPVKTKTVMLIVLVPPKIINELSSKDKTVREGDKVELVCNVTGVPTPEVMWYKLPTEGQQKKERLDLEPGSFTNIGYCDYTLKQTGIGSTGEVLIIHNVSRYCDGIYECVAFNDVDPAVTRQIKVFVEFAPEVDLNNKRMGQYVGRETILDCVITAYPHGIMQWKKDGRDVDLYLKEKYQLELYSGNENSKSKTLSLRIKNIIEADFGEYTCYAKNIVGQDRETMILYDYAEHFSTTVRPRFLPSPKQEIIPDGNNNNIITKPPTNVKPYWTKPNPGFNNNNNNDPYRPGEANAALGSSSPILHTSSAGFVVVVVACLYLCLRQLLPL